MQAKAARVCQIAESAWMCGPPAWHRPGKSMHFRAFGTRNRPAPAPEGTSRPSRPHPSMHFRRFGAQNRSAPAPAPPDHPSAPAGAPSRTVLVTSGGASHRGAPPLTRLKEDRPSRRDCGGAERRVRVRERGRKRRGRKHGTNDRVSAAGKGRGRAQINTDGGAGRRNARRGRQPRARRRSSPTR